MVELAKHGYGFLAAAVFLESIGFPVPAALALLIAGGACARGPLYFPYALASALSAMLIGDALMFLLGRYTGWWLLGMLCRLSLNPESCILRSAGSFHRRGRSVLLFAKFIPGINTMAPPLAGSMNMRASQFFRLDAVGVALYTGSYLTLGFLFSDALGAITRSYETFSRVLTWAIGLALFCYLGMQVWLWVRARMARPVEMMTPEQISRKLSAEGGNVYDVRSHGYFDPRATRIAGAQRLDPNALPGSAADVVEGQTVYLYCTCSGEATSARVARVLAEQGIAAIVIKGGLREWKKAGLPVEAVPAEEISALPVFES